ncbi:unnamed protein product [Victoria cruziana]
MQFLQCFGLKGAPNSSIFLGMRSFLASASLPPYGLEVDHIAKNLVFEIERDPERERERDKILPNKRKELGSTSILVLHGGTSSLLEERFMSTAIQLRTGCCFANQKTVHWHYPHRVLLQQSS